MNKKLVIILGIVLSIGIVTIIFLTRSKSYDVSDFQTCAAHYPVQESYPEVCRTPDGRSFTNPEQHIDLPE